MPSLESSEIVGLLEFGHRVMLYGGNPCRANASEFVTLCPGYFSCDFPPECERGQTRIFTRNVVNLACKSAITDGKANVQDGDGVF
jgi:hypothetical protein